MDLTDHIHCDNCHHPIVESEEVHTGTILRPSIVGNQMEIIEIPVPICQNCYQLMKARSKVAPPNVQNKKRLIVPGDNGG